jgi:hypothetical protein
MTCSDDKLVLESSVILGILFVKPFLLLLCVAFQISAICQEAGMHAVRKNRYVILPKDFETGY